MRKLYLIVALCFFLIPTFLFAAESPWFKDLNASELFVKVGFDSTDTVFPPDANDQNWKSFPPAERKGRLVRPIDIILPEIPKPQFLSLTRNDMMEFTYSIPFSLEAPITNEVPGLHLASLGDNWEIFLNGELIRSSIDLDENGQIKIHHSRRDVFFPIKPSLFKDGQNLLVIHILCDPTYESNGFHQAQPYYFDSYENISKANSSLLTFALLAIYLFMGIYHIFLYFSGRNFRYNLFYGLFSADLFLYLFMRTHIVYNLIANTEIVFKIELICLFGILPFVCCFLELITENKINKITKIYSIFSIFMALAVTFTPSNFNLDLLRIWQISGLSMILYIFFYLICWKFFSIVHRKWKREKDLEHGKSRIRVFFTTLQKTAIGNLFIGGFIMVGTGIFDILDSMIFQKDLVLTNYGFLIFTLGSAFILANRFAFLNKQMDDLNHSLEKKVEEVVRASEKSKISEKKYRSLFEGNSDAVLLLDKTFSILDGNNAGLKLLGIDRKAVESYNVFNSLSKDEKDGDHSQDLLKIKLDELIKTKKPSELSLRFTGKMGELKAVRVRLELIQTRLGSYQVLFRGVLIQEDVLLDHFVGEKIHYQISNSFPLTDEVSRRITRNLSKYMDRGEAEILFIGLREIIINAIEHGNLHISFDEKTKAQAESRYIELLLDRQKEPRYCDKKVTIEAAITPNKVIYRITDDGPGFDHKTFLDSTLQQVNVTLAHGRGISMAMQLFDSIVYNEKGNQVTLIKKLQK